MKISNFLIIATFMLLTSCESIFFYPAKQIFSEPSSLGLNSKSHYIKVNDKESVFLWELVPDKKEKGHLVFFHGNAGNVSTHIHSVAWLVLEGYRVFMPDYRGFGYSDGKPGVKNAVSDVRQTIEWVKNYRKNQGMDGSPLVLFTQSIGASLALFVLKNENYQEDFDVFIFDSPFSSYRSIARDKIKDTIILCPFSWPLSFLFTPCCSPLEGAREIKDKPVLLLHSRDDRVVGVNHSEKVFENIKSSQKEIWLTETGRHIGYFAKKDNRLKFLDFLDDILANK